MNFEDVLERSTRSRIVITGASGVIGRALIELLGINGVSGAGTLQAKRVPNVLALDRKPAHYLLPKNVDFELVDLLDDKLPLEKLLENCEVVFHLAARMPQARFSEAQFRHANVDATARLTQACRDAGVRRLVFASTIEVYGVQPVEDPLDEDDAKVFTGHYSRNKFESETELLELSKDGGLETVALRMPMIFGPGFYHEKSMIALFIAVRLGLPVPLPTADAPVVFVSSRDTARAFMQAAFASDAQGKAFNITAADNPTMLEFFRQAIDLADSHSRTLIVRRTWVEKLVELAVEKATSPSDKVPILGTPAELVPYILTGGKYSIERARKVLGFEPLDNCSQSWLSAYQWYWNQSWSEKYRVTVRECV